MRIDSTGTSRSVQNASQLITPPADGGVRLLLNFPPPLPSAWFCWQVGDFEFAKELLPTMTSLEAVLWALDTSAVRQIKRVAGKWIRLHCDSSNQNLKLTFIYVRLLGRRKRKDL